MNQPRRSKPRSGGKPTGRQRDSQRELGEALVAALCADFRQHGVTAIEKVRDSRPDVYLRAVTAILPSKLETRDRAFDDVADEELALLIHAARAALEAAPGGRKRKRKTAG
jgi:hypothetical protein